LTRNKVEICGVDTSKLPVLKNEEMRKLFKQMQAGDGTAREKLVSGNLRLVLSVIQRFNNRGEFVDDLFQVGCIGLMKSIDNFDLTKFPNSKSSVSISYKKQEQHVIHFS